MFYVVQKKDLKDGYYYSGLITQNWCAVSKEQPMIIGKWDKEDDCFYFWEFDGHIKSKSKLNYLPDIDNEIEAGFYPIKEIIPKDEHVIE